MLFVAKKKCLFFHLCWEHSEECVFSFVHTYSGFFVSLGVCDGCRHFTEKAHFTRQLVSSVRISSWLFCTGQIRTFQEKNNFYSILCATNARMRMMKKWKSNTNHFIAVLWSFRRKVWRKTLVAMASFSQHESRDQIVMAELVVPMWPHVNFVNFVPILSGKFSDCGSKYFVKLLGKI